MAVMQSTSVSLSPQPDRTAGEAIRGISSMATRSLLADLGADFARQSGVTVRIESVGGVDAARRVQAGEAFDVVWLASDAIDKLVASGHLQSDSRVDIVRSAVAVAVPAGAALPDIGSEEALRAAVLSARCIGYSTGPSGTALMDLFARWGIAGQIAPRLLQAPAGVPVGALLARGEVDLGFQQASELLNLPGIQVLGVMPPAVQITTTFSAGVPVGVGVDTAQAKRVRALLDFMSAPQSVAICRRHGMEPA